MKTKTLIRLLNKADPTGEQEVCVGNVDILDVWSEPAYYDGALQVLIRDENKPDFNVIGAKYVRSGTKINIITYGIMDAIYDNSEIPVDFVDCNDYYKEKVEKWREEARKLDLEIEKITKK